MAENPQFLDSSHQAISALFDRVADHFKFNQADLLRDLYDRFESGAHLRDSVTDHVSFTLYSLQQQAVLLHADPKAAEVLRVALLGGQVVVSILGFSLNLDSDLGMIEPEFTESVRAEVSIDPSGFSLVDKIVAQAEDPQPQSILGAAIISDQLPDQEAFLIGMRRTADIYKGAYLAGAQAGLGPMPVIPPDAD